MTTHTHSATTHNNTAGSIRSLLAKSRLMYQPSETRSSRSRVPHPGDILYWVGCIGAVSALLFVATR